MTRPSTDCVLSIEQECQTTFESPDRISPELFRMFFEEMSRLAPALTGSAGIFNGYGRVYVDTHAHLEFAFCECDDPYRLTQVVETQYDLARRATAALVDRDVRMLLVNNNHCGLLTPQTAFWGTHENYLIDQPAPTLTDLALPFLVTRTYAGSGGVLAPDARFLTGARHLAMQYPHDEGGSAGRSIFSTSRQEHHLGPRDSRERLHLLLGDGHRSQFNAALHSGATALAIKAMQYDEELPGLLSRVRLRNRAEGWMDALVRLNVLADPGTPPHVPPAAIEVQRIFLDSAKKTVDAMVDPPAWMASILADWSATLEAYENDDRGWLSTRLDAFIKYELFTHYLGERGNSWDDAAGDVALLSELALLDQDYHAISAPTSTFAELEARGLLDHRVAPRLEAGSEEEAFVPDVATRARARARFIKEHARDGQTDTAFVMSWEYARLPSEGRVYLLHDPFDTEYRTTNEPVRPTARIFDLGRF